MTDYYLKNKSYVTRFLINRGAPIHIAEDIYQDATLVILKNIEIKKVKEEELTRAYIAEISKRLFLKYLNKKEYSTDTIYEREYEDTSLENQDIKIALDRALSNIENSKRKLLVKLFLEEKNNDEVIREMNLKNSDTLKTMKYKSIKMLRKKFNRLYRKEELV
jgi:RNA polymerase sigma factor (sigma-70 family)